MVVGNYLKCAKFLNNIINFYSTSIIICQTFIIFRFPRSEFPLRKAERTLGSSRERGEYENRYKAQFKVERHSRSQYRKWNMEHFEQAPAIDIHG